MCFSFFLVRSTTHERYSTKPEAIKRLRFTFIACPTHTCRPTWGRSAGRPSSCTCSECTPARSSSRRRWTRRTSPATCGWTLRTRSLRWKSKFLARLLRRLDRSKALLVSFPAAKITKREESEMKCAAKLAEPQLTYDFSFSDVSAIHEHFARIVEQTIFNSWEIFCLTFPYVGVRASMGFGVSRWSFRWRMKWALNGGSITEFLRGFWSLWWKVRLGDSLKIPETAQVVLSLQGLFTKCVTLYDHSESYTKIFTKITFTPVITIATAIQE